MTPIRLSFTLNVAPKGKARPRRGAGKHMYMPKAYEAWREIVRWQVRSQVPAHVLGLLPLSMRLRWRMICSAPYGEMGPDGDNAEGALWDAIQVPKKGGWGLIVNDKQFKDWGGKIIAGPTSIWFEIEEL